MLPPREEMIEIVRAKVDVESVPAENRILEDLGANSAGRANIRAAIESEFGIKIDGMGIVKTRGVLNLFKQVRDHQSTSG